MASTIRHNRARGSHNIELIKAIRPNLDKAGMSDQWIMKNIGMDRDELLRLKQISAWRICSRTKVLVFQIRLKNAGSRRIKMPVWGILFLLCSFVIINK